MLGKIYIPAIALMAVLSSSCTQTSMSSEVMVSGVMRDVMWNGELEGKISLDSLTKENLYGLGPLEYLQGEILVLDGTSYISTIDADSSMIVAIDETARAPFFVYAYNSSWAEKVIPGPINSIGELEQALDELAREIAGAFVFRLDGKVDGVKIHTQNLAPGTPVSSPEEAHSGQVDLSLSDIEVNIVGFYSTRHKGIFTHHDSNTHMHLIDSERKFMGHLDDISFSGDIKLRLQSH